MIFNNNKEIVRKTFDKAAQRFDEIGTPFFKYYGKFLADISEIKPDDIILDIACGKGATTFPVSKKLSAKGMIYAIDISPKMIEKCNVKRKKLGIHNIDFRIMDAENLNFPNESIDKVISGFGLFFFPDPERGLKEIKRVLKPGGLLVFSSWNNHYQLNWQNEIISKYFPIINKSVPINHEKINEIDFRTIPGLEKILKIGGFKKEQILTKNLDCYYNNEEEWLETKWHTAFRMYFEQLSKNDYTSLKDEIIQKLHSYKKNGKIKITTSAFFTQATKT
jgi:O-methyltransferase/aklanonic acid methyltransferase